MILDELLPPGVYSIWSPYDSYEAAEVLTKMLAEEEAAQKPGFRTLVLGVSLTLQEPDEAR